MKIKISRYNLIRLSNPIDSKLFEMSTDKNKTYKRKRLYSINGPFKSNEYIIKDRSVIGTQNHTYLKNGDDFIDIE